jgi:hypothetical protein
MLRISGYGQTGPYRDLPGFGAIGEAMGGLRHLTGEPGRVPVRVGVSIGDTLAALHGVIGVLTALYHRKVNGGAGQVIDVALHEAVFNVMESLIPEYSAFGAVREAAGSALPGIAPSNAYKCSDGYVLVAGNGDSIFKRLMETIGAHDLGSAPTWRTTPGACARVAEIDAAIGTWTATRSVADVLATLGRGAVPAGKVYTAKDIHEDPHYRARDMILRQRTRDGYERGRAGRRAQAVGHARHAAHPAPHLGDDTDAVLAESGHSQQDIAALRGKESWHDTDPGTRDRRAGASSCRKSARATACRTSRVRPHRRQDRPRRCAVRRGPGEDRGHRVRLAAGHPGAARRGGRDARDRPRPGVVYTALVPNVRGAERAIESRADELNLVMSASESHNIANLRMTREQSFQGLARVAALARAAGVPVNISLSCAFGCPMEGDVPEATVLEWCSRFVEELGARGVTLCDTTGMAYPGQVASLTSAFPRVLARHRPHAALPQHARHGPGERAGLHRQRRQPLRRLARRPRRLPLCAGRDRQRLQRGDRARARAHGLPHRRRPRSAGRGSPATAGPDRPRHPEPDRQGGTPHGPAPRAGRLRRDPRARAGAIALTLPPPPHGRPTAMTLFRRTLALALFLAAAAAHARATPPSPSP